MRIRQAGKFDSQHIANLHARSWRTAYRGVLRDQYLDGDIVAERLSAWEERFRKPAANQYVAVAKIDRTIVGFVCAYGDEDANWGSLLENLHVSHEHKRQGIGARLMAQVASWCRDVHPGTGMYLWVLEPNTSAQRFYERLGAVKVGEDAWSSPDGGSVLKFRYAWNNLEALSR